MKKLSKKEWIAVGAGVIFIGYTLFGGNIMGLFKGNSMNKDSLAAATGTSFNNNGVIINDILVGSGAEIKPGQVATVHYILSLSDGAVIQNSKDLGAPFEFTLGAGGVIPGWELGFAGMKAGGVRTIVIPPELGYGASQAGPIPANSTLIFTIELVGIKNAVSEAGQ